MPHLMNDKIVTSNELVRTVICSVLEDLDNNFMEYAENYIKNLNEFDETEITKINQWKTKIFKKLNATLNRDGLIKDE